MKASSGKRGKRIWGKGIAGRGMSRQGFGGKGIWGKGMGRQGLGGKRIWRQGNKQAGFLGQANLGQGNVRRENPGRDAGIHACPSAAPPQKSSTTKFPCPIPRAPNSLAPNSLAPSPRAPEKGHRKRGRGSFRGEAGRAAPRSGLVFGFQADRGARRSLAKFGASRPGTGLDLQLVLTLKGACSGVPMESISEGALRDATCPNRFPPAAGVCRARLPDKSKTIACGAWRKTGRRIATGGFQGKRIWGKGMYGTRIQSGMPESMPVRLPLPQQKSSTTKFPCPEFACPILPYPQFPCPPFACPIPPLPSAAWGSGERSSSWSEWAEPSGNRDRDGPWHVRRAESPVFFAAIRA